MPKNSPENSYLVIFTGNLWSLWNNKLYNRENNHVRLDWGGEKK